MFANPGHLKLNNSKPKIVVQICAVFSKKLLQFSVLVRLILHRILLGNLDFGLSFQFQTGLINFSDLKFKSILYIQ